MAPPPSVELPAKPCLDPGCSCCPGWIHSLELLRNHAQAHVRGEIRFEPCNAECLICAEIDWQGRTG